MTIKRNVITIYFEFFSNVNLDRLEETLYALAKKKTIPKFAKMRIMVNHKGLSQKGKNITEIPLVIGIKENKDEEAIIY